VNASRNRDKSKHIKSVKRRVFVKVNSKYLKTETATAHMRWKRTEAIHAPRDTLSFENVAGETCTFCLFACT